MDDCHITKLKISLANAPFEKIHCKIYINRQLEICRLFDELVLVFSIAYF